MNELIWVGNTLYPRWFVFAAVFLLPWMIVGIVPALARQCVRLTAADTLILHGQRQHAECFIECAVGHWPNVDSKFHRVRRCRR